MTGRILCPAGHAHWPNQAWIHEKCVAPSRVTQGEAAINVANLGGGAINAVTNARTGNRRVRGDYNEYMREYMKRRRAAARAGFSA